jgi:hypothetical protein
MSPKIQIRTQRSNLADKPNHDLRETVVLRDGQIVAVLPEGDPLCYALRLSAQELEYLRAGMGPNLQKRPALKTLLETLIEYKRSDYDRR